MKCEGGGPVLFSLLGRHQLCPAPLLWPERQRPGLGARGASTPAGAASLSHHFLQKGFVVVVVLLLSFA